MRLINNKGQLSLGDSPTVIRFLVIIAITLALGALILNGFATSSSIGAQNTTSIAWNVTQDGLAGLQTFGGFQSLMALVLVAVIILSLVLFIGARQN